MTALHRVKAYFGMVPADELDAYDGYDHRDDGRYDSRHDGRYDSRYGIRYDDEYDDRPTTDHRDAARYRDRYELRDLRDSEERAARRRAEVADDRSERADDRAESHHEYGGEGSRPRTPRPRDPEHTESRREEPDAMESGAAGSRTPRGRSWAHNTGPNHTSVRPGTAAGAARSGPSLSSVPPAPSGTAGRGGPGAVDASRSRADPTASGEHADRTTEVAAPSEITSLQPTSYNEARIIGERYRDGIPVIMNLSDMDDVAAKRLVDFAAGLAFALRGSIEKVTNRVFLLSPPNVEVSAADRRKLAESGYSATS